MKKFFSVALAAAMVFSMTACGSSNTETQPAASEPAAESFPQKQQLTQQKATA